MTVIVTGEWTEVHVPYMKDDAFWPRKEQCADHLDLDEVQELVEQYLAPSMADKLTTSLGDAITDMLTEASSPVEDAPRMWSLDDFRRKGIDIGRPFQLHIDKTGGVVKARQKKWTGTDEW